MCLLPIRRSTRPSRDYFPDPSGFAWLLEIHTGNPSVSRSRAQNGNKEIPLETSRIVYPAGRERCRWTNELEKDPSVLSTEELLLYGHLEQTTCLGLRNVSHNGFVWPSPAAPFISAGPTGSTFDSAAGDHSCGRRSGRLLVALQNSWKRRIPRLGVGNDSGPFVLCPATRVQLASSLALKKVGDSICNESPYSLSADQPPLRFLTPFLNKA